MIKTKFIYSGFRNCESCCDIEIDFQNNIIVFTERADNPGTSVTNMIETLANLTVKNHLIDPNTAIIFEHYGAISYPQSQQHAKFNTIDLVEFDYTLNGYINPKWRRYENEEFLQFLKDLKSPLYEYYRPDKGMDYFISSLKQSVQDKDKLTLLNIYEEIKRSKLDFENAPMDYDSLIDQANNIIYGV